MRFLGSVIDGLLVGFKMRGGILADIKKSQKISEFWPTGISY